MLSDREMSWGNWHAIAATCGRNLADRGDERVCTKIMRDGALVEHFDEGGIAMPRRVIERERIAHLPSFLSFRSSSSWCKTDPSPPPPCWFSPNLS